MTRHTLNADGIMVPDPQGDWIPYSDALQIWLESGHARERNARLLDKLAELDRECEALRHRIDVDEQLRNTGRHLIPGGAEVAGLRSLLATARAKLEMAEIENRGLRGALRLTGGGAK